MVGRRKIKPWDPRILGNDIFPKGTTTFVSLQRRQWDLGILLNYLNWVDNFVKRSGHQRNYYDQSGATEAWWTKFTALWSASGSGQSDMGGEDCHVPTL